MALIEEELSHLARREQALFTEDMATLCVGQFSESLSQADTAEKLLADDMERLSVAEHERAIFDLHGISEYLHDERISCEMIDSKLSELEHELQKIHNKQDFERAKYLNESYVNDRAFRALFLICDDFDTRLAAQRMVLHFRVKRELFGDGQVLGRDIRLSDLSNDDMVALESGSVQILRTRDVAGRLVVLAVPSMKPSHVSVESIVRARWYAFHTHLKEKDYLKMGVVGIVYHMGASFGHEALYGLRNLAKLRAATPKKVVGIHYCYNDPWARPIVALVSLFLNKDERARFRTHFGSIESILDELHNYGIPMEGNPILPNGGVSLEWHREWLQLQRQQEENSGFDSEKINAPHRFDVLFGKSKRAREHTGNLRAQQLVEMNRKKYESAGKFEKTVIAERIVTMIHKSHGRFLRWEDCGWVEVSSEDARDKISHFFRNKRSYLSKQVVKKMNVDVGKDDGNPLDVNNINK